MRIQVVTYLNIEEFTGGSVDVKVSGTINCIYGQRPDGTVFATQRPGINIFEDCSLTVSDAQGRGVYYWNEVGDKYIVNYDTVYKGSYSGTTMSITAGLERVDIFECGNNLVLIDAENNEGGVISSAAPTTLNAITDTDFPPNQTPALTLAKGGAVINETMYVGTTGGLIFSSAVEDPTSWGALDFISAELKPDNLVAIYEHSNHIAAFGTSTLEFFYDNANATGSPLSVRQDIFHNIGLADFHSAWVQINSITFVGQTPSGAMGIYRLHNFTLEKISTTDLDSLITSALTNEKGRCIGSGFVSGGREFYHLTLYYESAGAVSSVTTFVHDSLGGWQEWRLAHTGIDDCPLMSWTKATNTRTGEGILSNGDLITVLENFNPQDITEATAYVEDGYVRDGYVVTTDSTGVNIPIEIVLGQGDSATMRTKFADGLKVVCSPTNAEQNITVQWSNEGNNNYNTGKTIDLSNPKNRINRLGKYKYRNYKLSGAFSERVEIEGIEVDVVTG